MRFQIPIRSLEDNSTRAADLRRRTMADMNTWKPQKQLPRPSGRKPALQTIPATIPETNKLIYATATVILEVLCYVLNVSHKG